MLSACREKMAVQKAVHRAVIDIPVAAVSKLVRNDRHREVKQQPESPEDLRFRDWCIRSRRFWQSSPTAWCPNNPSRPRRFVFRCLPPPIPLRRRSRNQAVRRTTSPQKRFHSLLFLLLSCREYNHDSRVYELSTDTVRPSPEEFRHRDAKKPSTPGDDASSSYFGASRSRKRRDHKDHSQSIPSRKSSTRGGSEILGNAGQRQS